MLLKFILYGRYIYNTNAYIFKYFIIYLHYLSQSIKINLINFNPIWICCRLHSID